MKVLLTGATGFLGRHVAEDLLSHGIAVRALVRDKRAKLPTGAEAIETRFDNPTELDTVVRGVDAVLHLAGKVSRDPKDTSEMYWLHVEATRMLLGAMQRVGVRKLVLASTSGTLALNDREGYESTERDQPPFPIIGKFPYYLSKLYQEQEVLRWDSAEKIDAVVLHPSLCLGPGDERLSSTDDVLKLLLGRVPAATSGTIAFVDVRDAAPAFRFALEKGKRGERYLLNGANMSVRSFAERVATAGGVSPPALKMSDRLAVFSAKVLDGVYRSVDRIPPIDPVSVEMSRYNWGCSSEKAEKALGFYARDPQSTIRDTVRYLEERGLYRRV
jgi:dihydroflavonol-4-reductase